MVHNLKNTSTKYYLLKKSWCTLTGKACGDIVQRKETYLLFLSISKVCLFIKCFPFKPGIVDWNLKWNTKISCPNSWEFEYDETAHPDYITLHWKRDFSDVFKVTNQLTLS